ncbi:epoxide hydrolase [Trametopsis cervina]|nr:epoxide hydrolase [Trametopsis cervina]
MTSPQLKAVIFDIGGVVCASPLIAIAEYEREHGIPHDYINCSITRRGSRGAWQRFERGEIPLFTFYEDFGRDLSDTTLGNVWYRELCLQRGIVCPPLPQSLNIDGRELFGRMMRLSRAYDNMVVEAIRRIRAAGRWRVIALTNNWATATVETLGGGKPVPEKYAALSLRDEINWLGWGEGAVSSQLREMFDNFYDSSEHGMRKPEPEFYLLACKQNNISPHEAVFLDDLGLNLKAAQKLGMETIHVPIGGSFGALQKLEEKLGLDLTSGVESSQATPSRL